MSEQLTKRQAAIVGAFTGVLAGPFSDMHKYINEIMGRDLYTHELASEAVAAEIKERSKADFSAICHKGVPS